MRKPMSKYRHMTREKAEEIRKAYFSRELTQKQLAAKYGISQAAKGTNTHTQAYYRWTGVDEEKIIPRTAKNVIARVDRLKALGNGQVPAVAATAWRILTDAREAHRSRAG